MGKGMGMLRGLASFVVAVAAAFCIAGGQTIAAFAQPQPTPDGRDMAAANAGLAAQTEGDVSYIERNWDGNAVTEASKVKSSAEYTVVNANTTSLADGGWYVVTSEVAVSGRISVNGTANLILCDGAKLTAPSGIVVNNGKVLNIYGQEKGSGALEAGSYNLHQIAAVGGGPGSTIAVHGGAITAKSGTQAAGIDCALIIFNGTVEAHAGHHGAGIGGAEGGAGGSVTVYGGTVEAYGGNGAAGIGGGGPGAGVDVTINGGTVMASGSNCVGIGAGSSSTQHGTLTLGNGIALYGGTDPYSITRVSASEGVYERSAFMMAVDPTEHVKGLIDKLPAEEDVDINDEDAIKKARNAYGELTDEEKGKVDETVLQKLVAAEKGLADAEAADAIYRDLPDLTRVSLDEVCNSKDTIEAARSDYEALTEGQKKKVSSFYLEWLQADEAALAIASLPATEEVQASDKDAIETAKASYSELTDDQKQYCFSGAVITQLEERLEAAEGALQVAEVVEAVDELPAASQVTMADKDDIEAARAAYGALDDDQKAKVGADVPQKLVAVEKGLEDAEAAEAVGAEIDDLPVAGQVTTADEAAIEKARAAYDALTDDQKAKVHASTLKRLTGAEQALAAALEKAGSDQASGSDPTPAPTPGSSEAAPEPAPAAQGVEMRRLYNPYSYEHFYTSDAEELAGLVELGWMDEGLGWVSPEASEIPVYRLYNPYNGGDHHYTKSAEERDALVAAGWVDENVGWYSADESGAPVYREYNPYEVTRNHNYTTNKAEHDGLVALGWHDEGTAWHGLA